VCPLPVLGEVKQFPRLSHGVLCLEAAILSVTLALEANECHPLVSRHLQVALQSLSTSGASGPLSVNITGYTDSVVRQM
jgi:hypothetical protein